MSEDLQIKGVTKTPDFIIIGAQKCGTSTLFRNLSQHPGTHLMRRKELHFFDENYSLGLEWYLRFFNKRVYNKPFCTGEASPYYFFHPLAPARISQTFPDIKLILLLRNPVNRAYSQYQHMKRNDRVSLSFEHCIQFESDILKGRKEQFYAEENHSDMIYRRFSFLARSRYAEQLTEWYRHFAKGQILIVKSEDYFADTGATLQQVFRFLDLPAFDINTEKQHTASAYPPMKPETRQQLQAYFEPYNKELYHLTGRDFGWD